MHQKIKIFFVLFANCRNIFCLTINYTYITYKLEITIICLHNIRCEMSDKNPYNFMQTHDLYTTI